MYNIKNSEYDEDDDDEEFYGDLRPRKERRSFSFSKSRSLENLNTNEISPDLPILKANESNDYITWCK